MDDHNDKELNKDNLLNTDNIESSNSQEEPTKDSRNEDTMIDGFSDFEHGNTGIYYFKDDKGFNSNAYKNNSYYTNDNNNLSDEEIRKIVREEIKIKEKKFPWFKTVALILLFSLLSSGVTLFLFRDSINNLVPKINSLIPTESQNITIKTKEEMNVENAVAIKAIPSVVGITTSTASNSPFDSTSYIEGVGSGVIVSEDGYILTNSHVVSDGNASAINVVFPDGEKIDAKLVWFDDTLDLAVVKVDKNGLPAIEFGNSDDVKVGDRAIAIGNPLGLDLQSTLTSGVISGLNRSITLESGASMDGLMQTDAAINGGNSGGALLNSQGELIGINTAKASSGEGIGFAIPVNIARTIVDEIIKTGNFESVILGISGVDLNIYEKYFELDTGADNGVAVMKVQEGSPAGISGLVPGDIITKIGSNEIKSMNDIRKILLQYRIGDKVDLEIVRNGKQEIVQVEFIEFEINTME